LDKAITLKGVEECLLCRYVPRKTHRLGSYLVRLSGSANPNPSWRLRGWGSCNTGGSGLSGEARRPYRASGNERGCPPDMKGPMMLMADRAGHPSGFKWDFAEFAPCHAACEEELLEVRLDEASIMCWCLRCKELRIFAKARYVDDPTGCPE
jgi:hypothetical protein